MGNLDPMQELQYIGYVLWGVAIAFSLFIFALITHNAKILGFMIGIPCALWIIRWFIKHA